MRAPVQLPPAPPVLLGRVAELARLDEIRLRSDPAPSVVVLTGVGRIGKTALALHWLHTRRARFPDGILCRRLSAEDTEMAESARSALHGFHTALGVPADDIPASIALRAAPNSARRPYNAGSACCSTTSDTAPMPVSCFRPARMRPCSSPVDPR